MFPIVLLSIYGIINLFLGFLKSRKGLLPLTLLVLAIAFAGNLLEWSGSPVWVDELGLNLSSMMEVGNFSVAFTGVIILALLLILPLSGRYVRSNDVHLAEYYSLLLFAVVGAIMMVSFQNLIMLFVGLEILSICMYILAGSDRRNLRSNEAALKYFLMGAFATGIFLFGVALVYGATGSFNLIGIGNAIAAAGPAGKSGLLTMGLLLILIGMLFKVSAAPFHFWTPDVYEGTPTLFTTFMSTVVKTAGFAALYRLLDASFGGLYSFWWITLAVICSLTLIVGNLAALNQTSVKRMLAYSSISHAGYLLVAVVAFQRGASASAILFYSLAYTVASVGAFGVLLLVQESRGREAVDAFNGLGRTNPLLAFVMTASSLSLAGIPLTGGFLGKLFVFMTAFNRGLIGLLVLAVLMTAVGIYYYFRIIIAMYFRESDELPVRTTPLVRIALLIATLLTVGLGIWPGGLDSLL